VNGEQRERCVQLLGDGATLRETASLVRMSWTDFSAEWSAAKHAADNGIESEEADWYRDCAGARAQVRATIRAEAQVEAGHRRSSDLLAVLARLEAEDAEEPQAQDGGDVRGRSLFLDTEDYSAETQEAIKEAQLVLHRAFVLKVNEDGERRRARA
jgi:hypothetical protein